MSRLTAKQRRRLPSSAFGLADARKYPVEDDSHAANAKARARQQRDAGHITQAQYDEIVRKADAEMND